MESTLVPILAVAAVIVVIAVAVVTHLRWKKRRERWAAAALELGLAVTPEQILLDRFGAMPFFQKGHGRRVRNLLGGSAWGPETWLADYQYTTGSGKSQRTHRATICMLRDPDLALPQFELIPENPLLDKFATVLGLAEIDFDDDPAFSSAFRLTGSDEPALRAAFDASVRAQLVGRPEKPEYVAAAGDLLLVHGDRLIDPGTAQELLRQAREIHSIFRG